MKYSKEIIIPFHWVDHAGVLFFARASELFHILLEDYMISQKKWDLYFSNPDYAFPIKSITTNFHKKIGAGDQVIGSIEVLEIRDKGFSLAFKVEQKDQLAIDATSVHICVSKHENKAVALPQSVLDLFK